MQANTCGTGPHRDSPYSIRTDNSMYYLSKKLIMRGSIWITVFPTEFQLLFWVEQRLDHILSVN